jgi:hypothetical protein
VSGPTPQTLLKISSGATKPPPATTTAVDGEAPPAKRLKVEVVPNSSLPVAERPPMLSRNAADEDTDSPEYNPYGEKALVITASSYGEGDVDAPKVLADLVEAIAGTVFLDCGLNLETLWTVFKPLLKPMLTSASKHPVVALLERTAKAHVRWPPPASTIVVRYTVEATQWIPAGA